MPGMLGKKIGMSNIYSEDGRRHSVTMVEVGPCNVLEVKTVESDGYEAVKLGLGTKKAKHTNKAEAGFYNKIKATPSKYVKEFKNYNINEVKVGDVVDVNMFSVGQKVKVSGTSIGKGFQGVMKRHNFGGVGGATHGQKDRLRHPGSIGQSSSPSRVLKGTRMAGRMGGDRVTVKNLKIIKIIPEKNIVMLQGAVPGAENSIIEINN